VGATAWRWAGALKTPARCLAPCRRLERACIRTRIQLNEIWRVQTTRGRLSANGQPADVAAAGRRRCPRSPAHARGRPSQTASRSRINTAVPCNHRGRPRIGPAPGGTTTALMHPGWRATRSHGARVHGSAALPHVSSRPAANIGNRPSTTCRDRRLAGRSPWGSAFRQ